MPRIDPQMAPGDVNNAFVPAAELLKTGHSFKLGNNVYRVRAKAGDFVLLEYLTADNKWKVIDRNAATATFRWISVGEMFVIRVPNTDDVNVASLYYSIPGPWSINGELDINPAIKEAFEAWCKTRSLKPEYMDIDVDAKTCSICRFNIRLKTRLYCKSCGEQAKRPTIQAGDTTRDVDSERALVAIRAAIKGFKMNECPVHGKEGCTCKPPIFKSEKPFSIGEYNDKVEPYYIPYPEFAVGLELEFIAPEKVLSAMQDAILLTHDASLAVEGSNTNKNWAAAETKIATISPKSPIHAARLSWFLRRMGSHVNKSCGLHVHVDRRTLPNENAVNEALTQIWVKEAEKFVLDMFKGRDDKFCIPLTSFEAKTGNKLIKIPVEHHAILSYSKHYPTFEFRASPATTNFFHAYAWVEYCNWLYKRAINSVDKKVSCQKEMPKAIEALARMRKANVSLSGFANYCAHVLRGEITHTRDLNKSIVTAVTKISEAALTGKPEKLTLG